MRGAVATGGGGERGALRQREGAVAGEGRCGGGRGLWRVRGAPEAGVCGGGLGELW